MCGILLVKSKLPIDEKTHLDALKLLEPRGPDLTRWNFKNNIFIGQTVLHITGSDDVYNDYSNFAFNGEIYNYLELSDLSNDAHLAKETVEKQDWDSIKNWKGPWAWAWTDFNDILYATDPQFEKHLFVYDDNETQIVTSEIRCIQHYVDLKIEKIEWTTKHWPMLEQDVPWSNVSRTSGGILYKNAEPYKTLDHLDNWNKTSIKEYQLAIDELDQILTDVCESMAPNEEFVLSYSGGLDSSLLKSYFPQARTVSLDLLGKDPIAQTTEADQKIIVDLDDWAKAYSQVVEHACLPLCSWNWASYSILAKNINERIIINGAGADELFGGYPYHLTTSLSPYSDTDKDTFLNDYKIQQGGVDLLGADLVSGMYGKETRTPFTHPDVVKFALSLPKEFLVNTRSKSILHDLYFKRTGKIINEKKQGFAGHCNDSIPMINLEYKTKSTDRLTQWKEFIQDDFYRRYKD
jgi:asparagine synthetase B (glutamine-hydrolysing)